MAPEENSLHRSRYEKRVRFANKVESSGERAFYPGFNFLDREVRLWRPRGRSSRTGVVQPIVEDHHVGMPAGLELLHQEDQLLIAYVALHSKIRHDYTT